MLRSLSSITLFVFFALLIILQLQDPALHEVLRYERGLMSAEPWRAVSHALLHLNFQHLLLNLVALACLSFLFRGAFQSGFWLLALLFSSAVSALGMYWFSPGVDWCVGLSGGLHGLFVYAVLRVRGHWIWLVGLGIKIMDEQFKLLAHFEWSQLSSELIDGSVVVDAHLWGALGGLIILLIRALPNLRTMLEISRD